MKANILCDEQAMRLWCRRLALLALLPLVALGAVLIVMAGPLAIMELIALVSLGMVPSLPVLGMHWVTLMVIRRWTTARGRMVSAFWISTVVSLAAQAAFIFGYVYWISESLGRSLGGGSTPLIGVLLLGSLPMCLSMSSVCWLTSILGRRRSQDI